MTKKQTSHVLSGNSGLLLSHLEHTSDTNGFVAASYNVIAQQLHFSLNTAFRCVDRLLRAGYIAKVPGAIGSSNGYVVLERADARTKRREGMLPSESRVGSERE